MLILIYAFITQFIHFGIQIKIICFYTVFSISRTDQCGIVTDFAVKSLWWWSFLSQRPPLWHYVFYSRDRDHNVTSEERKHSAITHYSLPVKLQARMQLMGSNVEPRRQHACPKRYCIGQKGILALYKPIGIL